MAFSHRAHPLPLSQIELTGPFWPAWQEIVRTVTLPQQYEQLVKTGRIANFNRAAGREGGGHDGGYYFNDSDVYKWLEACGYSLAVGKSSSLRKLVDSTVETVCAAQMSDGYLNTFFQLKFPDLRWRNLAMMHEMYCAGHLIEAAVALYEGIGESKLLDAAIKFADLIEERYGANGTIGYCGHEEIELALIRLSDAVAKPKYRSLARRMVEARGHHPSIFEPEMTNADALALNRHGPTMLMKAGKYLGEYAQDHLPIRLHTAVVGHAVRAMYLYMAATDLASESQDEELSEAMRSVWENLTTRRMYITGGIGPSGENEGFTGDYDLPNLSAYAETCAACGLVFWGQRLLNATGDSDYGDVIERALYNGVLAGISADGGKYFYDNPLESRGQHMRTEWFPCACCPPNIARLIASASNYMASLSDEAFWLNIPTGMKTQFMIKGVSVAVNVTSNYPWSGKIQISIQPSAPVEFEVRLRIPEWADEVEADLPSQELPAEYEQGYAVYRRTWKAGDVISIVMPMPARWMEADPKVLDDLGRVALLRGPLVYCAEEIDLGFAPQRMSVDAFAEISEGPLSGLPGGVGLKVSGSKIGDDFPDQLYAEEGTSKVVEAEGNFRPYYTWANRGSNAMQVWMRKE